MRVWASKRIGVRGVQFVPGWNELPDAEWDAIKGNNYVVNLLSERLLKIDEESPAVPEPTPVDESMPTLTPVELPSKAADVARLIRSMDTIEELEALGVQDDDRKSVVKAYEAKLDELGYYD